MTIKQLKAIAEPPTAEEIMARQSLVATGLFDVDDCARLVLYRRAVRAGYFNEGFAEDDALYLMPGLIKQQDSEDTYIINYKSWYDRHIRG